MDSPNTSYEPPIHDASQNTPPLPLNQENDSHFSDQALYQSPIFSSPQQSSKKILSPFSNDGNISSPLNSSINTSYGSTNADDNGMNLSYTEIQTNINSPIKDRNIAYRVRAIFFHSDQLEQKLQFLQSALLKNQQENYIAILAENKSHIELALKDSLRSNIEIERLLHTIESTLNEIQLFLQSNQLNHDFNSELRGDHYLTDEITTRVQLVHENVSKFTWLSQLPAKFQASFIKIFDPVKNEEVITYSLPEEVRDIFFLLDFEMEQDNNGNESWSKPWWWFILDMDHFIKAWSMAESIPTN